MENFLAFVIYLSYRRSYQNILKWDSPHSNNILTIFSKIGNLSPTWISMRNFKGLLNRWIETLPNEDPRFDVITKTLFELLFDPKIEIPAASRHSRLYSSVKITRANQKIVAQETVKHLENLLKIIEGPEKDKHDLNNYMLKILMLVNIRLK